MNTSTAAEAERIYTEYRQHGLGGWGPFIHYEDPARQARLDAEIDRLLDNTSILHVNDQTLWLPSPWHAVLFLIRAERYLKYAQQPQHQLYRGHADSNWRMISTFDRIAQPDLNREWTASTLYSLYLARRLYCPKLHIAAYGAVTRHMGFASKQMDWTVDPAVAVYFASQPYNGARDGRVYMLQVPEAVEMGLEVWCPPPFCDRIYSQLGVFLRPTPNDKLYLNNHCPSIQFPKSDPSHPFRVWRDGTEIELLRSHPWLEKSAQWVRTKAAQVPNAIDDHELLMSLVEEGMKIIEPAPPELKAETLLEQAEWSIRVLDLYHWLFIFTSRDGCITRVPSDLAVPIVRSNRALTALAAETIRVVKRAMPSVDYHSIEEFLDKLLDEAGPPDFEDNDVFGMLQGESKGKPPKPDVTS